MKHGENSDKTAFDQMITSKIAFKNASEDTKNIDMHVMRGPLAIPSAGVLLIAR